ncbi:G-type lectin S-receptor-like serine/threonine-protein kinase At1g61370 [Rutidosis leptorrhynchoides]|uniref:G-type lectin S-receptor-like serine/threonine-protein kinase At1g61370 n=1 Tax=Rutidosis leptorrhynchoides TaxID=125765 RepID=UPI003A9998BA
MSTKKKIAVNQLCLLYLMFISLQKCMAVDLLSKNNRISLGQTLVSANQAFELGFFSPGNSTNRYIGIWYKNVTARKIMWVANRKNPLSVFDNNSSLTIGNQGNLKILDGTRNTVWSTSINVQLNETIAQLTDTGCLYLNDTTSGSIVWESFDYPSNSLLPGMKLGAIGNTQGDQHLLTSWKNDYDATPGNFVVGLSSDQPPQIFIWDGLKPHWRGGPWDGGKFVGIPEQDSGYSNLISLMPQNTPGGPYLVINLINFSDIIWLYLSPNGVLQVYYLNNDGNMWVSNWQEPIHSCDGYGVCGAFAICADNKSPICECLKGFVPQSNDEWSKSNWTSGCVRRSQLSCEMNATSIAYRNTKPDKFQILKGVKLPDNYHYFADLDSDACQKWCFDNCSCKAYAFVTGIFSNRINCMAWTEDLIDIKQFSSGGENLYLRIAYADARTRTKHVALIISLTIIGGVLLLGGFIFCFRRWRVYKKGKNAELDHFNLEDEHVLRHTLQEETFTDESFELPMYEFKQILTATENFSYKNKIGEGGFGAVYKTMLDVGKHVAVKRLSGDSGQGITEFKNEIMLISKLQHRNLVKLLGCCIEGKERILLYEFMINKSLDTFLFDSKKRWRLDWVTRFNIIKGIGRGLIYLHRDSCLRIVHRDLKCSNILLDEKMNPKISDFGLARTFQITHELANTHRIVGTYGYMSPEYAMGGVISEKADVFSYGVMLLEIMSGKKNTEFIHQEQVYPLARAWKSWKEGRGIEMIDQELIESSCLSECLRCIHVGLLCIQDLPKDRPTMSEAVAMLIGETNLQQPKEPLFTLQRLTGSTDTVQGVNNMFSINGVTISMPEGR